MKAPGTSSAILLVSDSPQILDVIDDLLRADERLTILRALDCDQARTLASSLRPALVICQCKAGPECPVECTIIKEDGNTPAPLFLLLSDRMGLEEIARCLDQGATDYLELSLARQILLPKVHSLLRTLEWQRGLWEEEERLSRQNGLLEKNFKELTVILLKILEVRVPGAGDRAEQARYMADFLAHGLGLDNEGQKQVVFAAVFREMGKIGLPDEIVFRHYSGLPSSLISVYQQHVTVGSMIISTITGYREAAEAVYHQLENYDGSGFPGELMGEEIPLGARILRAIALAQELQEKGYSLEGTVEQIRLSMHTILDQGIANLLIEFLLSQEKRVDTDKVKVPVDKLETGMIIAEDIYAASGVKLLPKGVQLREKMLALILERHATDPIIGGVYIAKNH